MQIFEKLCDAGVRLTNHDIRRTKRRHIEIVRLRYAIGNILMDAGATSVEAGRLMGKDHSTLLYYKEYHKGRYQSDEEYARLYDTLSDEVVDEKKAFDDLQDVVDAIKLISQ